MRDQVRNRFRRHVVPALAAVGGHLDAAVVGADPDFIVVARRWRDRVNDAVAARGGVRDRDIAVAVLRAVALAGEIGADDVPVLAFVVRAEQHLRARVERIRRVRGERDRRDPRVAVFDVGRALAVCGRRATAKRSALRRCANPSAKCASPSRSRRRCSDLRDRAYRNRARRRRPGASRGTRSRRSRCGLRCRRCRNPAGPSRSSTGSGCRSAR